MENLANIAFYLLISTAIVSVILILVSKEAKVYIASTIVTFASIAGLYILLKSPVMFIIQTVFFVLGAGAILILGLNNFKPEKRATLFFKPETIFCFLGLCLFIFLCAPFLINRIKAQVISTFCIEQTFTPMYSFTNLILIMFLILIIATLSGFYTVAFWRKK